MRRAFVVGLLVAAAFTPAAAASERIVALAPNVVELLFAVGCGDRVVGIGDWARHPPEIERLPRIGGLFDVRYETIVGLAPDLAVLLPSERELEARLVELDIETEIVPHETLDDIAMSATALARLCGTEASLQTFLEAWGTALVPSKRGNGERALLVLGRRPGSLAGLTGIGPGTFFDELLALTGATNVLADTAIRYPQVSLEEIVVRRPTVVIEIHGETVDPATVAALGDDWADLDGFDARIEIVDGDHTLIPGPRIPRLFQDLLEAISP